MPAQRGSPAAERKPAAAAAPAGPPKQDVFEERDLGPTEFRRFYDRGDLPIAVLHKAGGNKVLWKVPIDKLDYSHFLPIFFDGLREIHQPYEFLAREALLAMLKEGGPRILPVVPQLIIPIKSALPFFKPFYAASNTQPPTDRRAEHEEPAGGVHDAQDDPGACPEQRVCRRGPGALLPPDPSDLQPLQGQKRCAHSPLSFSEPCLSISHLLCAASLGDKMDYSQHKRENLGELVQETLELMEEYGGPDAYIHIKYMIPTYESMHSGGTRRPPK